MLPKNKAQVTPSELTEQHQPQLETFTAQELKITREMSSQKQERCETPIKPQSNQKTGADGSIEQAVSKFGVNLKRTETIVRAPSLFRADFAAKRWKIIAKFIEKMKTYSLTLRFKKTKKSQLDIIDDQAFYYEYFFQKNHFEYEKPSFWQKLNYKLESYYQQGLVITDRIEIFWHYTSQKFIYDFILNICWLISLGDVSIWFKSIGVLRVIVIFYLLREIEETFRLREIFGTYFDLIKLGNFIFFSAHLIGCCWYALAIYERGLGIANTWLDKDIDNYDIEQVVNSTVQGYIASFYWSIVTMVTVGYGDIVPTTYRERIFVMVVILLSSFIFGFSMNAIGDIIRNLRENSEIFKQQMAILNIYMKKRELNQYLQSKVRRYFEYLYLERKENNQQGQELIESLAPFLRDEVQKDIYTNMFKSKKMFSLNFTDKLISSLYKIIKEMKYGVDDYLFKEGYKSEKLFLILSGEVQIILQDRVVLQTLRDGAFVGQIEFFSDKKYQFSCKTTKFTQIAIIDKKDFIQLLTKRQQDFEMFQQMKDNVLQYSNTSRIEHQCESCGDYGHLFDSCQLIQTLSNKHRSIYEYNSYKQITRQTFSRQKQSKSKREISSTQKDVNSFINDFNAKVLNQWQQEQQQIDYSVESDENFQSNEQSEYDMVEQDYAGEIGGGGGSRSPSKINLREIKAEARKSLPPLKITLTNQHQHTYLEAKNSPMNFIHQMQDKLEKPIQNSARRSIIAINYKDSKKHDALPVHVIQDQNEQTGGGTMPVGAVGNYIHKAEKFLYGFQNFNEAIKLAENQDVEDDFEVMKEYAIYYPYNNAKETIKSYNNQNKKFFQRKQRDKRSDKTKKFDMLLSKREISHRRQTQFQKLNHSFPTGNKIISDEQQNKAAHQSHFLQVPNNQHHHTSQAQEDNSFYTDNKQLLQK